MFWTSIDGYQRQQELLIGGNDTCDKRKDECVIVDWARCICIRIILNVTYNLLFLFSLRAHTFPCPHLCPKPHGRHNSTVGVTFAGGLDAIRPVCRAWQAFYTLLALVILKANPVSGTSPEMVLPHLPRDWVSTSLWRFDYCVPPGGWISVSPFPVYAREIWNQKPTFSIRIGYTYISLYLRGAPRLRSCRPAEVQLSRSCSLQLHERVAAVCTMAAACACS